MDSERNHSSNNYEKIENFDDYTTTELAKNYSNILKLLGEDNLREGLDKTPERVAKAMQFMLQGYEIDPVEILRSALLQLFIANYLILIPPLILKEEHPLRGKNSPDKKNTGSARPHHSQLQVDNIHTIHDNCLPPFLIIQST